MTLSNTMKEKIQRLFPVDELLGMRILMYAFFAIILGSIFILFFHWKTFGVIVVFISFGFAMLGMAIHWYMIFKQTVLLPKEFDKAQKEEKENRDRAYEEKVKWLKSIGKL